MIAKVELAKGTIETVAIDITDRLGLITDLNDSTISYDIASPNSENDPIVLGAEATSIADTMTALCQIDTTNDSLPPGEYWLFLIFTTDTDTPRIGPIILVIT